MSRTTSKDLKPVVKSNVRPEDEAQPLREKDSDGKKQYLNIPHPIAELIHKQILGVKTFGQFDHELAKVSRTPTSDRILWDQLDFSHPYFGEKTHSVTPPDVSPEECSTTITECA